MMIDVINADCNDFMKSPFCPQVDFAFADPPFNIKQNYDNYIDCHSDLEYKEWLKSWIWKLWNKLKPGACMALHGSQKVARRYVIVLEQLAIEEFVEVEIDWGYNFGQCRFTNFIEANTRCLIVRKKGKRTFNVENVLTESKRLLMGDPRVEKSKYKGYIPFGTVWGLKAQDALILEPIEGEQYWGRVQGNNAERRNFNPNQLPEVYLERLISAYTNPGDTIYDPFAGTGTTAIVAQRLFRNCITTELSENSCREIRRIITEQRQQRT